MKKRMSQKEFESKVKEAQKNPRFKKDIRQFIKITTGIYKLKDYGLK